jgi:hypothetical protein
MTHVDPVDIAELYEICKEFLTLNASDCRDYMGACESGKRDGYDPSQGSPATYLGHDLWLTSCGHGTGFWDRGLGDLGDRLTDACKHLPFSGLEHLTVSTDPSTDGETTPEVIFDGVARLL